jgi:hypothetical protein
MPWGSTHTSTPTPKCVEPLKQRLEMTKGLNIRIWTGNRHNLRREIRTLTNELHNRIMPNNKPIHPTILRYIQTITATLKIQTNSYNTKQPAKMDPEENIT